MRTRPGPRREINGTDALMLQQALDAEHVIRVTDGHATVQPIGAHDHGHTHGRLSRVGTLSLCNQVALGDSAVLQIIVADAAFAEAGIGGSATGRDNYGCNALAKKIQSVLECRPQYRSGTPTILPPT